MNNVPTTAGLTEQEQRVLTDLICFLFEHKKTLTDIYDKITMHDVVAIKNKVED